ncbi:MAG TPA: adenosylcobinamide-GDP ribazoletransferase [Gaiellaceae bacterium]|nr:adenosylcobinamide-GDP ribazoletransferase [Gaiellaceae bacterium]
MRAADAALAAVAFLTRIPVRRALGPDDVARGAVLFPLVGGGVGALSGVAVLLLYPSVPALAAAGVAVAVELVVTGAMHVDALADIADAAGAQTREQALEIMRDSRIGSFGAAALMVDLLTRAAAIAGLAGSPVAALVAAGALSRAASLPLAAAMPYARAEGGPGSVLTGRMGWTSAVLAALVALGVAIGVRGLDGIWAAAGAAGAALVLGLLFRRWLGGVTGDALGAVTELSGTVALLVLVAT